MQKSDKLSLSPGDVSLILRKSTKTVNRWGDQGLLGEVTMTTGGQRRYHRASVEAFLATMDSPSAAAS